MHPDELTPAPADFEIDDDQVAFFAEHGYLVLDRITTDEEIDTALALLHQTITSVGFVP